MTSFKLTAIIALGALPAFGQGGADGPCDAEVARHATRGALGYKHREGEKGDPRCEGTFSVPVSITSDVVRPISCFVLWDDGPSDRELVTLWWESQASPVLLRAESKSRRLLYRMDATVLDKGRFEWEQGILRDARLDLSGVGLVATTYVEEVERRDGSFAENIDLLIPLVVGGPLALSPEAIEKAKEGVTVTVLMRCRGGASGSAFQARWTRPDQETPWKEIDVDALGLLEIREKLPPDGGLWNLEVRKGEVLFEASYVRVPNLEFLQWAMGGSSAEEED